MEILLSAVLDELIIGDTNFFTSQFSRPLMLDAEDSFRWVLLQAKVIDDEALGRMDPGHGNGQEAERFPQWLSEVTKMKPF